MSWAVDENVLSQSEIGFFAPEMIIHGCYFGDKADVWSLGCILMELIMGHQKFCDVWMTAYDYDILQDKEQFISTISETVEHLPDFLNFSSELNEFVMRFLELRSSRRQSVRSLASHPWLEGFLAEELSAFTLAKALSSQGTTLATSPSNSFLLDSDVSSKMGSVSREIIDAAYSNVSDKERKQMEVYYQQHKAENAQDEVMHLPPITPSTPSIIKAKKILRKGNELANTNYGINHHMQHPSTNSTHSGHSGHSGGSTNTSEKSYDQYPYLSMTPESMSPAHSTKQHFLSPGRSPLPSVAEAHEGSQDPYDAQQQQLLSAHHSPVPHHHKGVSVSDRMAISDGKPSLASSQSDGKIWQGSAGSGSKGIE